MGFPRRSALATREIGAESMSLCARATNSFRHGRFPVPTARTTRRRPQSAGGDLTVSDNSASAEQQWNKCNRIDRTHPIRSAITGSWTRVASDPLALRSEIPELRRHRAPRCTELRVPLDSDSARRKLRVGRPQPAERSSATRDHRASEPPQPRWWGDLPARCP